MILREDSFLFRALMVIANPVPWLPSLLPLRAQRVRIGNNTTDFSRVTFWRM